MLRRLTALASVVLTCACGHGEHGHGEDGHGHAGGHEHGRAARSNEAPAAGHSHDPQHGGVLIALGDEVAHVELNVVPATGTVQAWLFDREVRPVRSAAAELVLQLADGSTVALAAVASALTGETVGATSCFAGDAPELVGARELRGTLRKVEVLGQAFADVPVHWTADE